LPGVIAKCLIFLVLFIAAHRFSSSVAQSPPVQEYQLKAAFLIKFAIFTEWPGRAFQSKDSPFIIGVLGENPFEGALDSLRGKTVNGRMIAVRHYTGVEDAVNCQVLFISGSEKDALPHVIQSLEGIPVLTVGDQEGFCRKGGMINMIPVEKNIRFEVNNSAARMAGLRISSQILKLARKIYE
jgi:hypothetical protein